MPFCHYFCSGIYFVGKLLSVTLYFSHYSFIFVKTKIKLINYENAT
jgi:hypothetical protein